MGEQPSQVESRCQRFLCLATGWSPPSYFSIDNQAAITANDPWPGITNEAAGWRAPLAFGTEDRAIRCNPWPGITSWAPRWRQLLDFNREKHGVNKDASSLKTPGSLFSWFHHLVGSGCEFSQFFVSQPTWSSSCTRFFHLE